jgi:hypothetical protein
MKVKDIVNKTTSSVVLVEANDEIVCDNLGYLGDYKKYENSTVKFIETFHSKSSGLYKYGIICVVKDKR